MYGSGHHVAVAAAVVVVVGGWLSGVAGQAQTGFCTWEHEGDLVLLGDETLEFVDGTLCVSGTIILRDNARLSLTNATLHMSDDLHTVWHRGTSHIYLHDNAQLTARHVTITVPVHRSDGVRVVLSDEADAEVEGVHASGGAGIWMEALASSRVRVKGSTLRDLRVKDRAIAEVATSTLHGNVVLDFTGGSIIELNALKAGYYENWGLPPGIGARPQLSLERTEVGGWWVGASDRVRIAIQDSNLSGLTLGVARMPDLIEGLRAKHYTSWNLHGSSEAARHGSVSLNNTWVERWDIHLHNRRDPMSVRNSIVHRLFVENSAMRITLDRATIWRFAVENSQLTLDCSAASTVELTLGSAHLAISGALREIKQNWTNTALTDSQVVRDFEIRLVGPSGEPVSNVTVDLEAPSREVSQHTSDVDGILHISIAFDDTNHGSEWILRIRGDAKAVVVPVYLLRSTPLRVVVP